MSKDMHSEDWFTGLCLRAEKADRLEQQLDDYESVLQWYASADETLDDYMITGDNARDVLAKYKEAGG